MKLISLLAIPLLLVAVSAAELAAEIDRFEVELHPGEITERTLILKNSGNQPIFGITTMPVAGKAKELVLMEISKFEILAPGEEVKVKIKF